MTSPKWSRTSTLPQCVPNTRNLKRTRWNSALNQLREKSLALSSWHACNSQNLPLERQQPRVSFDNRRAWVRSRPRCSHLPHWLGNCRLMSILSTRSFRSAFYLDNRASTWFYFKYFSLFIHVSFAIGFNFIKRTWYNLDTYIFFTYFKPVSKLTENYSNAGLWQALGVFFHHSGLFHWFKYVSRRFIIKVHQHFNKKFIVN